MFGKTWQLSRRQFSLRVDRDVAIPVSTGFTLSADVYRPDASGRFPAILCPHAYSQEDQVAPLMPTGFSHARGHMEGGDPSFYVRRGYAHVLMNVRGTGKSGGAFGNLGAATIADVREAIDWLTSQPWCDGNVGMFGASYFSLVAGLVAARKPKNLKCIFAPFAWSDAYRDRYYQGGILNYGFSKIWFETLPETTFEPGLRATWGSERLEQALAAALADPELQSVPFLTNVLRNPDVGGHKVLLETLLRPFDDPYYRERSVNAEDAPEVPAFLGACWGVYGTHLPGAFRNHAIWRGPAKLSIGPPLYLDRPLYQYGYQSLRWFDHWLKGNDTGMMEEPPISLFIDGTGEWRHAHEWPLPETRWTPFYLHEDGLLSEHELWPHEAATTFVDSPHHRGSAEFTSPQFVEATEICGPIVLTLYGSTTSDDVLWFVSLLEIGSDGSERLLTRGWLRGSQRRLDEERSRPWQPCHVHSGREPLAASEVYRFDIEVRPYGILIRPGNRLKLRIKCADDEKPQTALEAIALGHIARPHNARVTIHHDADHPSALILPITRGNRLETFISGGVPVQP
ncbi:MAG: CocE/NonD family hydrolase [Hyphomicrobiales bacterium]|nr:CocE/NonD family hydrolase [Hyphomicrobiales bacterium]